MTNTSKDTDDKRKAPDIGSPQHERGNPEASPATTSTEQADPAPTDKISVDDWAAALNEQNSAQAMKQQAGADQSADDFFRPLIHQESTTIADIDMIGDIPVQLSVELGRARLSIKSILQLGQGSVVELDGLAGEPMDIFVNGYLIAQGEVVVVDEKYGIRITDIITPADRINRLNSRR